MCCPVRGQSEWLVLLCRTLSFPIPNRFKPGAFPDPFDSFCFLILPDCCLFSGILPWHRRVSPVSSWFVPHQPLTLRALANPSRRLTRRMHRRSTTNGTLTFTTGKLESLSLHPFHSSPVTLQTSSSLPCRLWSTGIVPPTGFNIAASMTAPRCALVECSKVRGRVS